MRFRLPGPEGFDRIRRRSDRQESTGYPVVVLVARPVFVSGQDGNHQAIVGAYFHNNLTVGLQGMIHGNQTARQVLGTSFYQSVSWLFYRPDRQAESLAVSGPELYQSVRSAKHLVTEKPPPAGGGFEQQESLYIAYQEPSILFYIAYHSPLSGSAKKTGKPRLLHYLFHI